METIDVEKFNKLINLYLVFGIFALITCVLVICYLMIKLLRWSCSEYVIEVKKKD